LGASDAFDTSITDFSRRYADQNERDCQQFVTAIRSGRLEALEGVRVQRHPIVIGSLALTGPCIIYPELRGGKDLL
jgi:hypothetical protein